MRAWLLPLVSLLFLAPLAGCVEDDGPALFITAHLSTTEECLIEVGNPDVSRGVYDLRFAGGYQLFPRYESQLRARGSDAPLRADPNGIHVRSAEVELQDAAGNPVDFGPGLPNPFSIATSDFVPSSTSSTTTGQAPGAIQVIPPAYGDALDARLPEGGQTVVLVSVRVFGETNGDVEVESNDFVWAVDVCRDCLVACVDATMADEMCCTPGQDRMCRVGVDQPICMR